MFSPLCYLLYSTAEMNARNQLKSRPNASLDEDYQELGLRILGRIIARHLVKRNLPSEEKACPKTHNSPVSKDDHESISGTRGSEPA
jgi:hypothetical protein